MYCPKPATLPDGYDHLGTLGGGLGAVDQKTAAQQRQNVAIIYTYKYM